MELISNRKPEETSPKSIWPMVAWSELTFGQILGQGGFCVVSEISSVSLQEVYDTGEEESRLRGKFLQATQRNSSGYVVKILRDDLPEEEYQKGIIDLAIEASFLSTLQHPNIISMVAMANSDPYEPKFFVILERLSQTLDKKINEWRGRVEQSMGMWFPFFGYCCAKTHELQRLWLERLLVMRDIASAIRYLHGEGIVYRDLKPDNIGFDRERNVKLFDFGLAKVLTPQDLDTENNNNLYRLTGNTGSLRYMAPEVALELPYDSRVDAYSFGVLFWQVCALTTPYAGYSCQMHANLVVRKGYRPKPDSSWPLSWCQLMKSCWDTNIQERPAFASIVRIVDEECSFLLKEDGILPSRLTERIRAQKRKRRTKKSGQRLDVDTRLNHSTTNMEAATMKKHDVNVV